MRKEVEIFLILMKLGVGITLLTYFVIFLWKFFSRETKKKSIESQSRLPSDVRNRRAKRLDKKSPKNLMNLGLRLVGQNNY
jgi:hypothetical protein